MDIYALILWMLLPNGERYYAPMTYYDNKYKCELKVSTLAFTLTKTGNPWNYLCGKVVPEVPEEP